MRDLYRRVARIANTPTWARFDDFDAGLLPGYLRVLADRLEG